MPNFVKNLSKGNVSVPGKDIESYDQQFQKPIGFGSFNQLGEEEALLQQQEAQETGTTDSQLDALAAQQVSAAESPLAAQMAAGPAPGQIIPEDVGDVLMPIEQRTGRQFVAGVGDVIMQVGDVLTFANAVNPLTGWTLNYADPIGDSIRALGKPFQDYAVNYAPKEIQEFNWGDLGNPDFWGQEVARVLPNLLAMMTGGYAVGKVATTALNKSMKKMIKSGKVVPGVTAGGVQIKQGAGLLGRLAAVEKTGEAALLGNVLTRSGKLAGMGLGGGSFMNVVDGAMVAGAGYREARERGLSNGASRLVAANIWAENSLYMAIDMLSWGFAYAGIGQMVLSRTLGKAAMQGAKRTFAQKLRPFAIAAGVGGAEGMEEQFQETYQEWIVEKNIRKREGRDYMGYWDYFTSPEGMKVRGVAFATGIVPGGKAFINTMAERQSIIEEREEALNSIINSDMTDMQKKQEVIRLVTTDAAVNGRTEEMSQYLTQLLQEEKIDQQSHDIYQENLIKTTEAWNNMEFSEEMTDIQKEAYFLAEHAILDAAYDIEAINEAYEENVNAIKKQKGMNQEQKEAAIQKLELKKQAEIEAVENLINEKEVLKAAIINSVITESAPQGRRRYRKGVKEAPVTTEEDKVVTKEVKPGTFVSKEAPQLSPELEKKWTMQGQEETLNNEYREKAIENLKANNITETRSNILAEMNRLKNSPEGKSIKQRVTSFFKDKAKKKGKGLIQKGKDLLKKGVDAVKGVVGGVKTTGDVAIAAGILSSKALKAARNIASKIADTTGQLAKSFQEGFNKIKVNKEGKKEQIFNEDGSVANQEAVDQIRETIKEVSGETLTDEDINSLFPEGIPTKNGEVDIETIKQDINNILATEETKEKADKKIDEGIDMTDPRNIIIKPSEVIEEIRRRKGSDVYTQEEYDAVEQELKEQKAKERKLFPETELTEEEMSAIEQLFPENLELQKKLEEVFGKNYEKKLSAEELISAIEELFPETELTEEERKAIESAPLFAKYDKLKREGKEETEKIDKFFDNIKENNKDTEPVTKKKKKPKKKGRFGNNSQRVTVSEDPGTSVIQALRDETTLRRLLKMYRNSQVDKTALVVMNRLTKVVPSDVLGEAIVGAIFIKADREWQETLAHEYGGHIFYRAYKHTQPVKKGVNNLMETPLWDETVKTYPNLMMYTYTDPRTGESHTLTIEDLADHMDRLVLDKRTKWAKSEEAEYRQVRELIEDMNRKLNTGKYSRSELNTDYDRLKSLLDANGWLKEVSKNKQEALKEEMWALSTEENSQVVLEQMLGATFPKKLEEHKGYAKRFWNRIKRQFGNKEEISKQVLRQQNPELKDIDDIPTLQESMRTIVNKRQRRHTLNTYSTSQSSKRLAKDVLKGIDPAYQKQMGNILSQLNRDILGLVGLKDKGGKNIKGFEGKKIKITEAGKTKYLTAEQFIKDRERYIPLIIDSAIKKINKGWGVNSKFLNTEKIISFAEEKVATYLIPQSPEFRKFWNEITIKDIREDLIKRSPAEEGVTRADLDPAIAEQFLTDEDWIAKAVETIDEMITKQFGTDPDFFFEEGHGNQDKFNYEKKKSIDDVVSPTVQRLIRVFLNEEYGIDTKTKKPGIKKSQRGGKHLQGTLMMAGFDSKNDPSAFIDTIRSSNDEQTIRFVQWLENLLENDPTKADAFLMMLHKEFSGRVHEDIFSYNQEEDNEGMHEFFTEEAMAFEEKNLEDYIMDQFNYFYVNPESPRQIKNDRIEDIRELMKLDLNNLTDKQAEQLLKNYVFINPHSENKIDWVRIRAKGVNYNGVNYTLSEVVPKLLSKGFVRTNTLNENMTRKLVKQLIISSRMKNYITMVNNVEGNPTNLVNKESYIHNRKRNIEDVFEIQEYEKDENGNPTDAYFDRVDKLLAENEGNVFLEMLAEGQRLRMSYLGGLHSSINNSGSNYVRMNGTELMAADMGAFFKGIKDTKSGIPFYKQAIGVFGEKTRRYYVNSPAFQTMKEIKTELDKLKYLADKTYKDGSAVFPVLKKDGSIDNIWVRDKINEIKNHIQENIHIYKGKKNYSSILTNNGQFKSNADNELRMYVLNYAMNRIQAQRLMIGKHENSKTAIDYSKRASGAIARHIPFDRDAKIETVMFEDLYKVNGSNSFIPLSELPEEYLLNGNPNPEFVTNATDGAMYILPEDAQQAKAGYGLLNDFGNFFKFVYYGSSPNHILPKDQSINVDAMYLKGNTFVLTDSIVGDSKHLQNIKQVLEERKKRQEGNFVVAVAGSAVKIGFDTDKAMHTIGEDTVNHNNIDSIQKDLFTNEDGEFQVLSGENFGVQLILDKERTEAPLPVQMFGNIMINANNDIETQSIAEGVINNLTNAMQQKSNTETGDILIKEKYRNNDKALDKSDKSILKRLGNWVGNPVDKLTNVASALFPKLNIIKNSVGASVIAQTGSKLILNGQGKLKGAGTIGYQTSDAGHALKAHQSLQTNMGAIFGSEIIAPASLKKLGYKVGDVVLGTRIPASKLSDTNVLVIKSFHSTESGSAITMPAELTNKIGADLDGDAIFVSTEYRTGQEKWKQTYNKAFRGMVQYLSHPKMRNDILKPIEFESEVRGAISGSNIKLNKEDVAVKAENLSPVGDMEIFNDNVPARNLIGIAAVMNRNLNYLSFYNTEFDFEIDIDGKVSNSLNNENPNNHFGVAQIMNIILDNPTHLFANKLGITRNTVNQFIILKRMGYSFEQIATIMNSNAAKLYNKYAGDKLVTHKETFTTYTPAEKALLELDMKVGKESVNADVELENMNQKKRVATMRGIQKKLKTESGLTIKIDTNNINDLEVLTLLSTLDEVSRDVYDFGSILNVYKTWPNSSHQGHQIIERFERLGTVVEEEGKPVYRSRIKKESADKFKEDKMIKNNLFTLNNIIKNYEISNIVDSNEGTMMNNVLKDFSSHQNPMAAHGRVSRKYALIRMQQELSVLKDLQNEQDLILQIEENILQESLKEDPNLFLTESITMLGQYDRVTKEKRNKKFRINKQFINEYTTEAEIDLYKSEFAKLSPELQKAIIQLDFIHNRWIGATTAVLWSDNVWQGLNPELEAMRNKMNTDPLSSQEMDKVARELLLEQYRLIPVANTKDVIKKGNRYEYFPYENSIRPDSVTVRNLQESGRVHYIKSWDKGQGKYIVLEYTGRNGKYKLVDADGVLPEFGGTPRKITRAEKTEFEKKAAQAKIKKLARRRGGKFKGLTGSTRLKRSNIPDHGTVDILSREEWLKKKGITLSNLDSEAQRLIIVEYNNYVEQMENEVLPFLIALENDGIKDYSIDELINLSIEYGNLNQYEQEVSELINGIIGTELAIRYSEQQTKVTGVKEGTEDISWVQMWLMSNNIPGDHPAAQAVIKKIETEHAKYVKAYKAQVARISKAERAINRKLRKEVGWPKYMQLLLTGKWGEYKYRNMIDIMPDNYIRLKSEKEIKALSPEEIEFYESFVELMRKYEYNQEGYIPHMMMNSFESFANRGLFGLYNSKLGSTADINHIMVDGLGPSGKKVIMPFQEWREMYRNGAIETVGGRKVMELEKLRTKAYKYLKSGKDANGKPIGMSKAEARAMLGSNLFKDFASSKQVKMADIGTKNLGDIGRLFARASVFARGDSHIEGATGFEGMERVSPLIDGLIKMYKQGGNMKMAKYFQEVWKDGYLLNRKQEQFGKVGDTMIDAFIKYTLYGVLGFGIIPAIGNILIGKYNQMRSKGGKEFALGEKRFWDHKNWKRNHAIINKIMRHEYNVFDDIYSVKEKNKIDEIVFWPMNASEFWIQGAAFLGTMTEQELNAYDVNEDGELIIKEGMENSALSPQETVKRYDKIKREQGRGYSPVDQRLMGMYSWGRAMLQFTRWFPTLVNERFGPETINRFGEAEIGSYTAAAQVGRDLIMGKMTLKEFKKLPQHKKDAIKKWGRGVKIAMAVALMAAAVGGGDDKDKGVLDKLLDDIFIFTDPDRMKWTLTPASYWTMKNVYHGTRHFATGATAERSGLYLEKGEKKWKSDLYRTLPALRPFTKRDEESSVRYR